MFRRITTGAVAALAAVGIAVTAAPANAYPGPDGYDSGSCLASTGMKLGASNWFSGTGQIVAIDVDDSSSSNSLKRVQWSSPLWVGTATTSLARKEIYRASKTEVMRLTLYTSSGATCSLYLDGSM
jgi:hypothetical protein